MINRAGRINERYESRKPSQVTVTKRGWKVKGQRSEVPSLLAHIPLKRPAVSECVCGGEGDELRASMTAIGLCQHLLAQFCGGSEGDGEMLWSHVFHQLKYTLYHLMSELRQLG